MAKHRYSVAKVRASLRDEVNREFAEDPRLNGNAYHERPERGYALALDLLARRGIELGEVVHSWHFQRPSGRILVRLAFTNPEDSFSPTEIENSALAISWHRMSSGRYEVVAYLS